MLIAGLLFTGCQSETIPARTGSWGDQGDGTYKNPILNADYPDVDVEQVGDTYYMISSKQHMSPGMVILESRDMVNWTTIGHVWDRLDWAPEYNWDQMAGYSFGVWAGDFAFHDGLWYCYQVDNKHGLMVRTAENIRGPWSATHLMMPTEMVLDDPAVFWDDEEHQAYLIANTARKLAVDKRRELGNENRIFKMSWDGKEVLDSGRVVYTGPGAEAAKIYKRSKTGNIYGPYEKRIVMERGNGIIRSCSQGGLMQAPDGSWWYIHQRIQNIKTPFQGRPQCLEPVEWIDGWPIIGKDVDRDGIGEPVVVYQKPINGFPISAPPTDDEFNVPELGLQWEWNHNPRNEYWTLDERPGWLRLKAGNLAPVRGNYRVHQGANFWRAHNTLSQRIMGATTGVAMARFDLSGMKPGQKAGFVRYGGVCHLLGVEADSKGARSLFFMDKEGKIITGPAIESDNLFIRTNNAGNKAFFEYSLQGQTYERFGPEFTVQFGLWTGDRLGFFCWNDSEEGWIDVDWFRYEYDGPKAARTN
jgi:beta-xylosidase